MDCLFCKIINGDIPSYKIYEDDKCLAFLDINPDTNGHTLIIPKKHYKDLLEIDSDTLIHIINISKELINKLTKILKCNGMTLVQNNGDVQEIKHFHIHLKPYYNELPDKKEIENIYNLIRK